MLSCFDMLEEIKYEILDNEKLLLTVKELDDKHLGKHQSIDFELLQNIFFSHGILIATLNQEIVAYSIVVFPDVEIEDRYRNKNTVLFYGTVVLPQYRHKGIGTQIAKFQEKICVDRGVFKAQLSVRPENAPSILLRQKQGFIISSYNFKYFSRNLIDSGRFIMEKNLLSDSQSKEFSIDFSVGITVGENPDYDARFNIDNCLKSGMVICDYRLIEKGRAEVCFSEKS